MRRAWIAGGLVVIAALLVAVGLGHRAPTPRARPRDANGSWFEVRVEKPAAAQPLGGLFGLGRLFSDDLGFDQSSPGAAAVGAAIDRIELRADGWDLTIEADDKGRIEPGTHLVFPIELANRRVTLRCRPADPAVGGLHTALPGDADELDGTFSLELAECENVASGKSLKWPPRPLTVRGTFDRLRPHGD